MGKGLFDDVSLKRAEPSKIILDIETGLTKNKKMHDFVGQKEFNKVMSEVYKPNARYKAETNNKKAAEFEQDKHNRAMKAKEDALRRASLDPMLCRIVSISYLVWDGISDINPKDIKYVSERKMTQRQMIETALGVVKGPRTFYSYGAFDITVIRFIMMALQIETTIGPWIDVMDKFSHWLEGRKKLYSLDQASVFMGGNTNPYAEKIAPFISKLGDIYDALSDDFDLSINVNQFKRKMSEQLYPNLIKYGKYDVWQLFNIIRKLEI